MKRIVLGLMVAALSLVGFAGQARASFSDGDGVPVSATILGAENLTCFVYSVDGTTGNFTLVPGDTMDYGVLVVNELGNMFPTHYFQVQCFLNPQGQGIELASTANQLLTSDDGAGNKIDDTLWVITPLTNFDADPEDDTLPGSETGPASPVFNAGAGAFWYRDTQGRAAETHAVYGLGDPQLGIPIDQAAGTYVSTVTLTLTPIP